MHVDFDHQESLFADDTVARAVEAVLVVLQPVPQCNARDRQAVTRLVDEAGQQLTLLLVDAYEVRRDDSGQQRAAVRGTRCRQVRGLESHAPGRHVPTGVTDDELGE